MVPPQRRESITFVKLGRSNRYKEVNNRIFRKEVIYYHYEFSLALENYLQLRMVKRRDDCIPNRELSTTYFFRREGKFKLIKSFTPVNLTLTCDGFSGTKIYHSSMWDKFIVVINNEELYFS